MRKAVFAQQLAATSDVYYTRCVPVAAAGGPVRWLTAAVLPASSRMIDDGIIDPRDTRSVLGLCLSVVHNAEVRGGNFPGICRM